MCMLDDISQAQPLAERNKLATAAEIIAIATMKLRAIGLTDTQIASVYKSASQTKDIK